LKRFQARTLENFGFVIAWTRHVLAGRDLLRRALEIAHRIGDLTYAGLSCGQLNSNLLFAGDPLVEVQREVEGGLEFAQNLRFGVIVCWTTGQLALIRSLRGLTAKFGSFDDGRFDELAFERHLSSNPALALPECWYWIRKLQARFLAGDYAAAVDASSRAQPLLWTSMSLLETAEYQFYGALSRAASWDSAVADERQPHLEALDAHHRQLEIWAENCPENFENRAALVSAEIARIEGRALDAMDLYERAIRSARANGFVHNEALANELAARFYAARGFETISHTYLRNARYCYLRWGADGKVRQLDQLNPQLKDEAPVAGPTSTIGAPLEHLDLATVIKVSQAVSGEIVLAKLIETLMRTAVAQAGAERALLILARGAAQRIAAEATTRGDTVLVHLRDDAVVEAVLPESVLHYVLHTQESVILDDAVAQSPFAADPYIRARQARSVLCLPLLNQAKLIGVLYLENNLAPRVFAPVRTAVLKLLASQAAISLENTRLYRDLAEREAKIRRLVDANIIGIVIWNLEGQILDANDAFLRMVGYDREDLVSGRIRWTELTPTEWRDRDVQAVEDLKTIGTMQPFEKEYFRKDSSRVPVLIGGASFEEGGNQGVAFVLDLTERKRAEQAVQRLASIVESSNDAIASKDLNGIITSWNKGAEQLFGYAAAEIIGKPVTILIPPERYDEEPFILERIRRGEGVDPYETVRRRKDGTLVDISLTVSPIKNADGRIIGASKIARDISERKRAEDAFREVQMELAHANRVATMGQLTASIAHEVNQPLAATVTNAQAALRWLGGRAPDLEEVRQALARIIKDGHRAGDVVDRIRALIHKAPPRRDRLDINAAIRELIELTRGEAVKNGVSVRTQLADGLPLIHGDRVQLQQVILNLIINAVEAISGVSEGVRDLLISTGKAESSGVLVAVKDWGPGLAPAGLERLFEAFYTTKPGGLGMGLSICRSIIDAHGGRLWASANVPQGAIFQFSLPPHPNSAS